MINKTRTPIRRRWLQGMFLLACVAPIAVPAATLKSMAWDSSSDAPVLQMQLDDKTEFTTTELEQGKRLRVTLEGATLSGGPMQVQERGAVKGVFPYMSDDGKAVHVDFLTESSARLDVTRDGNNYRIAVLTNGQAAPAAPTAETKDAKESQPAAPAAAPTAGNTLEDIQYSALPGGRVQLKLKMTKQPEEPGSFSINKPPRVALDFFGTRSKFGSKTMPVGSGTVESISAIEANGRTRVVLNLTEPAGFETSVDGNVMTVVVGGPASARGSKPEPAKPVQFAKASGGGKHTLQKVDFRRGAKGEGRVIVDLSDNTGGIEINEGPGEIIVDFLDTAMPENLERRLDVVDFATPVRTIDTFRQNGTTRMVVQAAGKYEHLVYQTGNVFTLEVKPPSLADEKKRKSDEFGYSGEKLSLNFQNIEVRAALRVIADFTGLNFVTSDSVKGNLTLRLKDVPWDQALDIILSTRGLAKREKGNVIWVAPAEEIASKEKLALEAEKSVSDLEPLVSELIPINYAKASDIAKLLKSIKAVDSGIESKAFSSVSVSKIETDSNSLLSPRGNVTVDNRTNTILIQDTAGKIREVKKLIAELDKPVRQVMIETRIVEAADDFSRSIGARFGVTNRNRTLHIPGNPTTNAGDAILTGRIENTEGIYNDDTYLLNGEGLNVDLPSGGLEGDAAGSIAFTLFKVATTHLLQLELSALEAEGRGKIIANPRLVTANQKEAHIEQGQERIFPPSGFSDSPTIVEAKLSLTVTPQVTPEDSIILDVQVTQDNFVSPADPTVNTKQITTQVLLNNGETVVIGGIYQQENTNEVRKIPLFGDIPVVGTFFRKKNKVSNKTELLIFLTPRILSPALKAG